MKTFCLVICLLVLTGCATKVSPQAAGIEDASEVLFGEQDCKFIGDVHGTSGWGNLAASQGIENAKNEAREQAAIKNATHIIWTNIAGGYSPYATGKAYMCVPKK